MPSDNNQEMFPIVDEQGNIGAMKKEKREPPRTLPLAENVTAVANCFIR